MSQRREVPISSRVRVKMILQKLLRFAKIIIADDCSLKTLYHRCLSGF